MKINDFVKYDYRNRIASKVLVYVPIVHNIYTEPVIFPINNNSGKRKKNSVKIETIVKNGFRWGPEVNSTNIDSFLVPVILENTGFKISLIEDKYYYATWRRGHSCVKIKISHPKLEKYGPLYTWCPLKLLFNHCITGGIINGELIGTCCIEEWPYFSGYGGTPLILETKDEDIEGRRNLSKYIDTIGYTTKWIPGHAYITRTNGLLLYLGKLREAKKSGWEQEDTTGGKRVLQEEFCGYVRSWTKITDAEVPCFIKLCEGIKLVKDGMKVSEFLNEYLESCYVRIDPEKTGILKFNSPRKEGCDLGKLLDNDKANISEIISNFCKTRINGEKESAYLIPGILEKDIKVCKEEIKQVFSNHIKNKILEYNSRTYLPYGKITRKTSLDTLKSSLGSGTTPFPMFDLYLSYDEIDSILLTVLKKI